MTLGTILQTVLGPSIHRYEDYPTESKLFTDRNGNDYYHHVGHHHHHHHHKSKGKTEKKHAILSALSLLAFLFFLNILANCIREQNANVAPIMMFSQSKAQITTEEYKRTEERIRRNVQEEKNESHPDPETGSGRKSRTLLQVAQRLNRRQEKFIRHLRNSSNWTNELSQLSEKDLEEQKMKTLNFSLWKHKKLRDEPKGVEQGNLPPVLRRLKKRERLTTERPVIVYPSPPEALALKSENSPDNHKIDNNFEDKIVSTEKSFQGQWHLTDYKATTVSQDFTAKSSTFKPEVASPESNRADGVEPSVAPTQGPKYGLNLDTYQTYPMPHYDNHRLDSAPLEGNQIFESETPNLVPEVKAKPGDRSRLTPEVSTFYPKPFYPSQPYYEKMRYRNKQANSYGILQKRNDLPVRYRYSPYRKIGTPSRDHLHNNYYPVVVAARYPDDDGFDIVKFAWTTVAALAKPLAKLVPGFGKDSPDEYQCYDLIVCEAQRASKYMGPTAETLASTLGTMLTWAVTEDTRPLIEGAIKSGKENTCLQQIKDCEDRSGGRSAITVIAQLLEIKAR